MPLETSVVIEKVKDTANNARVPATEDVQKAIRDRLGSPSNLVGIEHTTDGTTQEQLPSNEVHPRGTVMVVYKEGNSGTVYVGADGEQPAPLSKSGDTFETTVGDTAEVFVRATNAGDSVGVLYET
jgi:hypothetical protein